MDKVYYAETTVMLNGMHHTVSAYAETKENAVNRLRRFGEYVRVYAAVADGFSVMFNPDYPLYTLKGLQEISDFIEGKPYASLEVMEAVERMSNDTV